MMLAQVTNAGTAAGGLGLPDPAGFASIGWVLVIAVTCIVGARQVLAFWRDITHPGGPEARRVLPSPLQIENVQKAVTEADCKMRHSALEKDIADLRRQRSEDRERDNLEASKHRKSMYDKMDAFRAELGQQIQAMPTQIVTQLLNTKQLWRDRNRE